MDMKNYEKQDGMGYDALREIGSIGTGNAATALSTSVIAEISKLSISWKSLIFFCSSVSRTILIRVLQIEQ